MAIAALTLSMYCCTTGRPGHRVVGPFDGYEDAPPPTTPPGDGAVPPPPPDEGGGGGGDPTLGMTVYVDCFGHAEGGSKTWRNQASSADRPGSPQAASPDGSAQYVADGTLRDLNFSFASTPAFSPRDGFALGANRLTGPYSHHLGINGDMAFTVFIVCQFTGALPDDGSDVVALQLFANTVNNNGVKLVFRAPGVVACQFGNEAEMVGRLSRPFDPSRRYLWVVVREYGFCRLSVVDLDAPRDLPTTLVDAPLPPTMPPLVFSNKDMEVNPAKEKKLTNIRTVQADEKVMMM